MNEDDNPPAEIAVRPGAFAPEELPAVKALLDQGVSLGTVARQTGRNKSYISRLAKRESWQVDRAAQTLPAREARASDLAVKRLHLAALAAEKLEGIIQRLDAATVFRRVNPRNGEIVTVRQHLPDAAQTRDLSVAAGILFDKVAAACAGESTGGGGAAVIELVRVMRLAKADDEA